MGIFCYAAQVRLTHAASIIQRDVIGKSPKVFIFNNAAKYYLFLTL